MSENTWLQDAERVMRTGDAPAATALALLSIANSLEVLAEQGEKVIEALDRIDDQVETIGDVMQDWTGHRGLEVKVRD